MILIFNDILKKDSWNLQKIRLAHKIDDSPALLVLQFQMPHVRANIHSILYANIYNNTGDIIL